MFTDSGFKNLFLINILKIFATLKNSKEPTLKQIGFFMLNFEIFRQ